MLLQSIPQPLERHIPPDRMWLPYYVLVLVVFASMPYLSHACPFTYCPRIIIFDHTVIFNLRLEHIPCHRAHSTGQSSHPGSQNVHPSPFVQSNLVMSLHASFSTFPPRCRPIFEEPKQLFRSLPSLLSPKSAEISRRCHCICSPQRINSLKVHAHGDMWTLESI